jgi:hypothetical protein
MIAPLAKFIDWSALQAVRAIRLNSARKRPVAESNSKLEEALKFLSGSDFIPPESQPARVEWNESVNFHFLTPRPGDTPQNNVAHGRLYRCAKDWRKHPAIILLHGAGDYVNHRLRFPLLIPRCARAEFNAATLVLPYHFQRRRRPSGALDHLRRAEATAQFAPWSAGFWPRVAHRWLCGEFRSAVGSPAWQRVTMRVWPLSF